MRQSRIEIYLHFVRGTYRRLPLLSGVAERAAYTFIRRECEQVGCEVLALGGMPDHVHLAVRMPATVPPAMLMQRVKGGSSAFVRSKLPGETFGWQDGYGDFSFSRSHRARVIDYVDNQKQHHAEQRIWSEWEEPTLPSPTNG